MTYSEYLKSPEWHKLRKQALNRADYRCQTCNGTESINVHHRVYPVKLGTEPITDLVVLCRCCHKIFHNKKVMPQYKIMLKAKISSGKKQVHLWVKLPTQPGKYRALCNPGLVYSPEDLFSPSGKIRYCKVCELHSK